MIRVDYVQEGVIWTLNIKRDRKHIHIGLNLSEFGPVNILCGYLCLDITTLLYRA